MVMLICIQNERQIDYYIVQCDLFYLQL